MSRFVNLELGGESEEPSHQLQGAAVKDESYYFSEARSSFENADFERALRLYAKVLEFNPGNSLAWAGQVRMLIELNEFQEARVWVEKALEKFPHEPELLAAKAVALGRLGDLQGALAFSDAAIQEPGDIPYAWLARGDVLLARSEPRADYCFEKAVMLSHRDWFMSWLVARVRQFHGQFALALKAVHQALEWNTGHFVLWLQLGQCQEAVGLIGPARQSFTQARQLNPDCREARLALVRLAQGGVGLRLGGWWRRLFRTR